MYGFKLSLFFEMYIIIIVIMIVGYESLLYKRYIKNEINFWFDVSLEEIGLKYIFVGKFFLKRIIEFFSFFV